MIRLSYHYVVVFVYLMVDLWGCGTAEKWVNLVNEPSGIQLGSRYMTSTKSVKVKASSIGLLYYIYLPTSLPRINKSKLALQVKKFNFKGIAKQTYAYWVKLLASGAASETTDSCDEKSHAVEGTFNDKGFKALFTQKAGGDIGITITRAGRASDSAQKESGYFDVESKAKGAATCIQTWAPDATLLETAESLLTLRREFVQYYKEHQSEKTYESGSRLNRNDGQSKPLEAGPN